MTFLFERGVSRKFVPATRRYIQAQTICSDCVPMSGEVGTSTIATDICGERFILFIFIVQALLDFAFRGLFETEIFGIKLERYELSATENRRNTKRLTKTHPI